MYSQDIEVDGEKITVEQGDVFEVNKDLEFGKHTLESGNIVTVANISRAPDGVYFEFSVDGEPGRIEEMTKRSLEKNIDKKYMSFN